MVDLMPSEKKSAQATGRMVFKRGISVIRTSGKTSELVHVEMIDDFRGAESQLPGTGIPVDPFELPLNSNRRCERARWDFSPH
jgi:hypothetical protein